MNERNRSARRPSRLLGLLGLNALLLGALGLVCLAPSSEAQLLRARGAYTMAAGGAKGSNSEVLYVVDTINRELIALRYDADGKRLAGVGYRNLVEDAARLGAAGR